jgi:putative spermidine/putrescine transport system ATP-binding protein
MGSRVKPSAVSAPADQLSETGRKPKLSVRGATKVHGTVVALDSASFDLFEGEFLTLLGPSGSGKTTLLMLVAGLSEPTAGEIWIDGKLATYAAPHLRDIGMVFQNYALFPHLTVRENVAFPLRMRGVASDEIDAQVNRALRTVQLEHTAERLPRSLSGGQQQRIALARCFVYRPSIILMDEPLGALDRKLRDRMQIEINQLHRELGITVLYVTHDQDEAMAMSDRICLMNEGRIEQIGTPEELYFRPRTIFAADFIGDSNLIDVTVESIAPDGRCRVAGPGRVSLTTAGAPGCGPGAKARIMVRPERVRILGPGDAATNVLRGIAREALFVGSAYKCCIELADGTRIWGRQPSGDRLPRPVPGQEVAVGWDALDCVVLGESAHG